MIVAPCPRFPLGLFFPFFLVLWEENFHSPNCMVGAVVLGKVSQISLVHYSTWVGFVLGTRHIAVLVPRL